MEYVPARINDDGTVVPVTFHGSAHLAALMEADGLLIVPLEASVLEAGRRAAFSSPEEGLVMIDCLWFVDVRNDAWESIRISPSANLQEKGT